MNIFDFRDMFAGVESVAFVGNASSVLSWDHGDIIDACDMVVRFNRAYVEGLEDKIGARTDVLVANDLNSLDRSPSPAKTLKPRSVVTFVKPKADLDPGPLKEWVGDIPYVITLGPDIPNMRGGERTRSLTMGTYALYTFLRLFSFKKVFVTGFTMFGVAPGGGEKYYKEKNANRVGAFHDLFDEAAIFADILSQFEGELVMTPEVATLVKENSCIQQTALLDGGLRQRTCFVLSKRLLKIGFYFRRLTEKHAWLYHDND